MDTWTHQMGFPLVSLTRDGDIITATQERFLLTPERGNSTIIAEPKSKYDYKWYVPLTYFTDLDSNINNVWMNMSDGRYASTFTACYLFRNSIFQLNWFQLHLILDQM